MKRSLIFCLLLSALVHAQDSTRRYYAEDFTYLWETIGANYAYLDKKATDWNKVKALYAAEADTITTRSSFVGLLERVLYELYDHHASLNTNNPGSQRLVPSGADLWAEYRQGVPVVSEVRYGYGAWQAGLRAGMELVAFNDQPIEKAIVPFLPKSLLRPDPEARNYALRVLLAGAHNQERKITARDKGGLHHFYPDSAGSIDDHPGADTLEVKTLAGGIGYLRLPNRLWDNALIHQFDTALNRLMTSRALILDLRETPSGGNTTVARAILSRFITREGFYQGHELPAEEREFGVRRSWKEIVSPRGRPYTRPLVVLANHWTGSVSEGIVIGFDGLKRATVIGTPMARLNGAIYSFQLPHSGIGFSFPAEKLYQVNGKPREAFTPTVAVAFSGRAGDEILQQALAYLHAQK